MVALLLVVSVNSLLSLRDIGRAMNVVSEETTPIVVIGGQLMTALLEANRTAVQHTGNDSPEALTGLESRFGALIASADGYREALDRLASRSSALHAQTETLAEPYSAFVDLGPAIFEDHRSALQLAQRVNTLAADFESTGNEVLGIIDSLIDGVQGELEAVRTLYRLRETIVSSSKAVLQAHARGDLSAAASFAEKRGAHVGLTADTLTTLEDGDVIDAFDLQELVDLVDTYNSVLTEPNRFFALLLDQLRTESAFRKQLRTMNQAADAVVATLESVVAQGEELSGEAKTQAT